MAFSGSRLPRARPTTMASASAATMPSVEPSQVPNQPWSVARVIVASMVLSPSPAKKNATPTAIPARLPTRLTFSFSSSVRVSPRSVHRPKMMKAIAAARLIQPVGGGAPRPWRMPTDPGATTGGGSGSQAVADAHRHQVHDRGGDRDAEEDRPDLEAGGEGQRHELRLVTELGDEDDAEGDQRADEDCVHGTVGPSRSGRDEVRDLDPAACCLDRRPRPPRRSGAARPDVRRPEPASVSMSTATLGATPLRCLLG